MGGGGGIEFTFFKLLLFLAFEVTLLPQFHSEDGEGFKRVFGRRVEPSKVG